jgi:hypothetical protein
VIFALLHFSNTYVFEKWRYVPIPHHRLLKNEFFNSLLAQLLDKITVLERSVGSTKAKGAVARPQYFHGCAITPPLPLGEGKG